MTTRNHRAAEAEVKPETVAVKFRLRKDHFAALGKIKEPGEVGRGWHLRKAIAEYLERAK